MPREQLPKEEAELLKEHRDRLKQRFLTQDTDYMNDARLLELLITYAIPRKDVYQTAVKLLAQFGDIESVLCANVDELCSVKGIGKNTAILISLMNVLRRRAIIAKNNRKTFNNPGAIGRKMCELFSGVKSEKVLVLTFNGSMQLLSRVWLSSSHPSECIVDNRELAKIILNEEVAHVAIAHNHPNGNILPSAEDIRTSMELGKLIETMEVHLIDTFIVSGDEYYRISDAIHYVGDLEKRNSDTYSYVYEEVLDNIDFVELAEYIAEQEAKKKV